MLKRWSAILMLRCPRCFRGRIFRSFWHVQERCSQCGLKFGREEGYFFGAMYFSYALGILLCIPTAVVLFFNQVNADWIGLAVILQLTVFSPFLYRYSRVVWLHFDHLIDPPEQRDHPP